MPADKPPEVATELIPDHVFGPSVAASLSPPDQLRDALGSTALGNGTGAAAADAADAPPSPPRAAPL